MKGTTSGYLKLLFLFVAIFMNRFLFGTQESLDQKEDLSSWRWAQLFQRYSFLNDRPSTVVTIRDRSIWSVGGWTLSGSLALVFKKQSTMLNYFCEPLILNDHYHTWFHAIAEGRFLCSQLLHVNSKSWSLCSIRGIVIQRQLMAHLHCRKADPTGHFESAYYWDLIEMSILPGISCKYY